MAHDIWKVTVFSFANNKESVMKPPGISRELKVIIMITFNFL